MHPYVLYNHNIVQNTEAIFRVGQLGLLSGWGVFSTLRIYEGIPFAFDRHWQRLQNDAELLNIDLCLTIDNAETNIMKLITANAAVESSLRICVFRSEGGYWAGPGSGNTSDLVAMTNDLHQWKDSVRLGVNNHARFAASHFAGTKTLSWAHNLTLLENARRNGFDETILINEHGEVTECTSANLFVAINGVAYTPPLTSGPLPGVTRALMLEELDLSTASVQEKALTLEDLLDAEEVFITSTTRELLPVSHILDNPIGQNPGGPWPLMERLRIGLNKYVRDYIKEHQNRTNTPS